MGVMSINKRWRKNIVLVSLFFFFLLPLTVPTNSFSEQSDSQTIYVKSFMIRGNKLINADTIQSKLIKMGLKIKLVGLRKEEEEKEGIKFPLILIPFPEVTVEELEEKDIEKKEFEELIVEEVEAGEEAKELPVPVTAEEKKYYTLEELKMVANAVTFIYKNEGYILARAYIPKQEVIDDVVTIAVLEGKLGDVEVSGSKYYSESYIRGWFKHLKGTAVKEDEIDRAILLAGDTPSLNISSVLKRGKKPGTADLALNIKDSSLPIKLYFDYDNHGKPLVSRDRFGVNLQVTDPIIGSTLSLKGITGNSFNNTFYGGIDYHLPVNYRGTRIGARYINADYLVGGDFGILGIKGESRILGVYVSHQIIRSRNRNLKATLGFDYKHMFEYILDTQRSNDDISNTYLRLDYDGFDRFNGKNYLSLNYSHGFNKLFGALDEDDPVASRVGADGRFDKFNVDYARVQRIWKDLTLLLKGSSQYSFNSLVYAEQFNIGGANTVRGHQLSKYTGDHGYSISAEIYSPLPFISEKTIGGWKISELFQAVIFGNHGGVYTVDPIAGEAKNDFLSSVGVGARLYLFDRASVMLDIGYPVVDGEIKTKHEIVYIQGIVEVLKF